MPGWEQQTDPWRFDSSNNDGTAFGHGVGHPQVPEEEGVDRGSVKTRLSLREFRHLLAGI
jgi:hypothetical protein